jgi:hypothetical protein
MDDHQPSARAQQYEKLAEDLLEAYRSGDSGAMQRLTEHTGLKITRDRLRENMQLGLGKVELSLSDAQLFLAQFQGFDSWQSLTKHIAAPACGCGAQTMKYRTGFP